MGVLVGTALIVIIPEGVETLYSASDYTGDAHTRRSSMPNEALIMSRGTLDPIGPEHRILPRITWISNRENKAKASDLSAMAGPVSPPTEEAKGETSPAAPPKTPTEPGKISILENDKDPQNPESTPQRIPSIKLSDQTKAKHEREPHAWIGLSLILGFILMYLLDTLPFIAPQTSARPQSNIYSLSDLSTSPVSSPAPPQRSFSTTLGLCIHAAADGIALGASSSSSSTSSLSLIIFVAIMVHKAPAAFGLTSVLLKQGLGKKGARAHLIIFSVAAPAGAVATWVLVRALGGGGTSEPAVMKWWTGVLLLFSGGTFLLVSHP